MGQWEKGTVGKEDSGEKTGSRRKWETGSSEKRKEDRGREAEKRMGWKDEKRVSIVRKVL